MDIKATQKNQIEEQSGVSFLSQLLVRTMKQDYEALRSGQPNVTPLISPIKSAPQPPQEKSYTVKKIEEKSGNFFPEIKPISFVPPGLPIEKSKEEIKTSAPVLPPAPKIIPAPPIPKPVEVEPEKITIIPEQKPFAAPQPKAWPTQPPRMPKLGLPPFRPAPLNKIAAEKIVVKDKNSRNGLWILTGVILLAAVAAAGAWYYIKTTEPTPTPSGVSVDPNFSVFPIDQSQTFQLTDQNALNAYQQIAGAAQTFIQLLPQNNKIIVDFSELTRSLNFGAFTSKLAPYLQTDKYTFFAYLQNPTGSPFDQGTLPQGRLGLAVLIKKNSQTDVKRLIDDSETSLLQIFQKLFFDRQIQMSPNQAFETNIYKNIQIRFSNFPKSDLSFDWTIVNDVLLITTSKESTYGALDRILANQPSQ